MSELSHNVLGGFLAATAFAVTVGAWKFVQSPLYISQHIGDITERFAHLPMSDGVIWIVVKTVHDYEARGYKKARTRFLRRELRSYGSGQREQILLISPPK